MPTIHPTAVVDPAAKLAQSVTVGPYCIIGPEVTIGANTHLHSHVVISGKTTIGANNTIYPFASLGQPPQDLKYDGEVATLTIGDENTIREYVTMHIGTAGGNKETRVGSRNLFMALAHVAHDCVIGDDTVLANGATLAGHVHVGNHAIVGGLAAVHQFVRIGPYAMIGGHCGIALDVPPYAIVSGRRAFLAGLNLVGLRRHGFSRDDIQSLNQVYDQLFFGEEGTLAERITTVTAQAPGPHVQDLIEFVQTSKRGITPGENNG